MTLMMSRLVVWMSVRRLPPADGEELVKVFKLWLWLSRRDRSSRAWNLAWGGSASMNRQHRLWKA